MASLGFAVQAFGEATADLRALLASRPGLVIVGLGLDPQRDELSGLQTIHAARSTEQLRDVPIVACSADAAALSAAWPDFMERGDIHQLQIPFDLGDLEQVVGSALGRTYFGRIGPRGTSSANDGGEIDSEQRG